MENFDELKKMVFEALAGAKESMDSDEEHSKKIKDFAKKVAHVVIDEFNENGFGMSVMDRVKIIDTVKMTIMSGVFSGLAEREKRSKEQVLEQLEDFEDRNIMLELATMRTIRDNVLNHLGYK